MLLNMEAQVRLLNYNNPQYSVYKANRFIYTQAYAMYTAG